MHTNICILYIQYVLIHLHSKGLNIFRDNGRIGNLSSTHSHQMSKIKPQRWCWNKKIISFSLTILWRHFAITSKILQCSLAKTNHGPAPGHVTEICTTAECPHRALSMNIFNFLTKKGPLLYT